MKRIITSTLIFLFGINLFAQKSAELFKEVIIDKDTLSDKELVSYRKSSNKLEKDDKLLVKLLPIENVFEDKKYKFTLPLTKKKAIVTPVRTEYTSKNEFTFFGKTEDMGDFIYTVKGEEKTIFINFENYIYKASLLEDSKDKYLFIRHNKQSDSTAIACGTIPSRVNKAPKSNKRLANEPPCEDSNKLRVLVLYTQNATNYISNMWAEASTGVNLFNAACWNSAIGQVQAELIGPYLLQNWSENNLISTEVSNMSSSNDIWNLRQIYKADVVFLIGKNSQWEFTARSINYDADPSNAFVAIDASYVNTGNNFVHMLGHLLSARHEQCNIVSSSLCDDNHPYSHAWRFGSYCTVDFHSMGFRTQINHFSNPNVNYAGQATGTSSNDNARRISETFPTVKSYRTGPGVLQANVSVSGNYNPNSQYQPANNTYNFYGYGSCGVSPYAYNWEVSTDGINFSWAGSGDNFSVYLGEYDYKIVRLKVYSSDFEVAYKAVTLISLCNGCKIAIEDKVTQTNTQMDLSKMNSIDDFETFKIFPNPVKNQFQLGFKVPREGNVKIDIINLQGKIIRTLSNKKYSSGVYYLTHDCTAEPTGVYLCKMELDGAFVKTEKLIIEK